MRLWWLSLSMCKATPPAFFLISVNVVSDKLWIVERFVYVVIHEKLLVLRQTELFDKSNRKHILDVILEIWIIMFTQWLERYIHTVLNLGLLA